MLSQPARRLVMLQSSVPAPPLSPQRQPGSHCTEYNTGLNMVSNKLHAAILYCRTFFIQSFSSYSSHLTQGEERFPYSHSSTLLPSAPPPSSLLPHSRHSLRHYMTLSPRRSINQPVNLPQGRGRSSDLSIMDHLTHLSFPYFAMPLPQDHRPSSILSPRFFVPRPSTFPLSTTPL